MCTSKSHISHRSSFVNFVLGLELCITYDVCDPKDFVESYVAYSVNHLDGGVPTNESLIDFERKELANHQIKSKPTSGRNQQQRHRNLNDYEQYDDVGIIDDDGDDLMDTYICNTPKVSYYSRNFVPFLLLFGSASSDFSFCKWRVFGMCVLCAAVMCIPLLFSWSQSCNYVNLKLHQKHSHHSVSNGNRIPNFFFVHVYEMTMETKEVKSARGENEFHDNTKFHTLYKSIGFQL